MFENAVAAVILDCPHETIFIAAVSGGADSMAMLAALCAVIRKDMLYCLHIDHGLRPPEESAGDAGFVRDFCAQHGIACRIESIPHGRIESYARRKGSGIEAAARFFRRRALLGEAARLGGNVRILTAHTKDDMLETSLMRVLRGAGPAGLASMPVSRGKFLRPLLSVNRADVLEYLTEKKIPWREDSTNTDEKYLRNRIRHQLIPFLNESFSSWKSGLSSMAETQSLAAAFIGDEARRSVEWEWDGKAGALYTDEEIFFSRHQIVREEALFLGVNKFYRGAFGQKARRNFTDGKESSLEPKRSVVRRFCKGSIKAADLGPLRVRREKGKIFLSPLRKAYFESGFSLLIN